MEFPAYVSAEDRETFQMIRSLFLDLTPIHQHLLRLVISDVPDDDNDSHSEVTSDDDIEVIEFGDAPTSFEMLLWDNTLNSPELQADPLTL